MTIEWNKVTWYSKLLAVVLFILTFWVAFCLGFQYNKITDGNNDNQNWGDNMLQPKSGDLDVKIGESKRLGNIKVTLDAVLSDNRCPADVQCIWAGNITTKVSLSYNNLIIQKELASDAEPLNFSGFNFSIKSVTPASDSRWQINPEDYVVTFHIEKA
ncbi:MAG: hypothetical protein AB198_01990 [Parcubacteria bacterium C7867-003]|nr:MAG: hypothetical protein AB198_01990 [Parcubacteria bacterium C7867-003]